MKTSIAISSTKSHTFNITSMLNTSIQKPSSRESEMSTSIEDQEPCSRDSRYQTGPPLRRDTVGNLMLTPDKPGKMPSTTWTQSGLPCNSLVRDKNQTSLNGSDSSNGVKEHPQDCSTMKCQSHGGSDTEVTWTTSRRTSSHSLMPIKSTNSYSVLTPPHKKVERNSRRNGKLSAKSPQSSFPRRIWYTPMRCNQPSPTNPTSEECGNSTESTSSEWDSPLPTNKEKSLMKISMPSRDSHQWAHNQHSLPTCMLDLASSHTLPTPLSTNPPKESWKNLVLTILKSTESQLNHMKSNSGNNTMLSTTSLRKKWERNCQFLLPTQATKPRLKPSSQTEEAASHLRKPTASVLNEENSCLLFRPNKHRQQAVI